MGDLTAQVRRKLNITWTDSDTDARVAEIIASGRVTMAHKLGVPADHDFAAPGQDNMLFLAWCLYEWNHATDEYDQRYLGDVMQARQRHAVEAVQDV